MRVIVPSTLTLDTTNVAASAEAEWLVGTEYSIGNTVKDTRTVPNKEFESLQDVNSGNDPVLSPTWWVEKSATNQHKMIDNLVLSQTENLNTIEVTIAATGAPKQLVLQGLIGETVQIVTRGDAVQLDDVTLTLRKDDQSSAWSQYFFDEIEYRSSVIYDIPGLYRNMEFDITITASTGTNAKCGHVVVGKSNDIGLTEYDAKIGLTDYSRKETNDFGEAYLLQRTYANTVEVDFKIHTTATGGEVARIQKILTGLRATPCLWDLNNSAEALGSPTGTDREELVIFGFFTDFDINLRYSTVTECTLEIEGLT